MTIITAKALLFRLLPSHQHLIRWIFNTPLLAAQKSLLVFMDFYTPCFVNMIWVFSLIVRRGYFIVFICVLSCLTWHLRLIPISVWLIDKRSEMVTSRGSLRVCNCFWRIFLCLLTATSFKLPIKLRELRLWNWGSLDEVLPFQIGNLK